MSAKQYDNTLHAKPPLTFSDFRLRLAAVQPVLQCAVEIKAILLIHCAVLCK